MQIDIGYRPREQFIPFHQRSERFACLVCHRRAGKTVACVHDLLDGGLRCELVRPRFAYVAPFLKQAKTVAWDYLRAAVSPLRDLGATINESELRVDLHNGAQVRLFGADNVDALRGIYLDGIVLDEYAGMDPGIAQVIGPALADRKGWAVYIGTPKGHNDFYEIYRRSLGYDRDGNYSEEAKSQWFSLLLKASESKLIGADELDIWKRNLSDSDYRQEYECDFEAAVLGSYYGKLLAASEADGRICGVPYDPACQVWTAWDLGYRDATAVWFAQVVGKEIHLIDYYEAVNTEIADDVKAVLAKPYNYAGHIVPHDAYAHSKQTGRTTADLMASLGLRFIERAPDHRPHDGISGVQVMLPRCWFDAKKTQRGLECLRLYRADYDEKLKTLKQTPLHDWTSHCADALRYLAMTIDGVDRSGFYKKIIYPKFGVA